MTEPQSAEQRVWRPMETAPRGITILVWRPKPRTYQLVQWDDDDYQWQPYEDDGLDRPSHWILPPEAPP